MDTSISGVYVLFREYDQKTKHLAHKIELLEEENYKLRAENLELRSLEECEHDWRTIEYNAIRSVDQCTKCGELRIGRGNY